MIGSSPFGSLPFGGSPTPGTPHVATDPDGATFAIQFDGVTISQTHTASPAGSVFALSFEQAGVTIQGSGRVYGPALQ